MKFDSYSLYARLFPGVLSSIPFFVLHLFYFRSRLGEFWGELLGLKIISDITLPLIFLFTLIQLSRFISKQVFENRIFKHGQNLPTTDFLLHLDPYYSPEYTNNIHTKLKTDFGIEIPTLDQERKGQTQSRKLIGEAVSHIRARVGKGNLVLQHNAEYGFWRNLAGGSVIALVVSLANIGIFYLIHYNQVAFWTSIVLSCTYLLFLIFAKFLIISAGRAYAKVLIQEYMSA